MRHAATTLSLCVALISGIVLALVWAQPPLRSSSIQAEAGSDIEKTASVFYQAVNTYLDGGDDAPLRRILHPDFVNHDPGNAASGPAATYLQQLDSVRALYPGIQLEPKVEYVGDNAVSVSLSLGDRQRREFAGIGIDPADMVGRIDLLRIERSVIVERWSSARMAGDLDAYPALSIDLPFALDTLVARVQKVRLEESAEPTFDQFGHLLLIVRSGQAFLEVLEPSTIPAVSWSLDRSRVDGPAPVVTGTIVTLRQMEAVLLPAGTRFQMWKDGNRDTALLALEFGPPVSGGSSQPRLHLGGLENTLWSGIALTDVGQRLTLSFGHASLLPQATISIHEVKGMEMVWVSDGAIELAVSRGEARVRDASGVRSQPNESVALLQAGDTGAAGLGSDTAYRATGATSATVWFFSIVSAGIETSGNDPSGPATIPAPPPPRTAH
jgi:hypothetical protein